MGSLPFFLFTVTLTVELTPRPRPPATRHSLPFKSTTVHLKSSKGSDFSIHAAVYQFPCFTFLIKKRKMTQF